MRRVLELPAAVLLLTVLSKKLFERVTTSAGNPVKPPFPAGPATQTPRVPVTVQVKSSSTAGATNPANHRPGLPGDTWTGVLWDLMVGFVVIPLVSGAWAGLLCIVGFSLSDLYHYHSPKARDECRLPSLSLTPLRSLAPAAEAAGSPPFQDGALVRVERWLCGDPPIAAFNSPDQLYALQCLRVTHGYRPEGGETYYLPKTYTDHKRNLPSEAVAKRRPVGGGGRTDRW